METNWDDILNERNVTDSWNIFAEKKIIQVSNETY